MRRRPTRYAAVTAGLLAIVAAVPLAVQLAVPSTLPRARAAVTDSCGAVLPIYGVGPGGQLEEWLDQAPASAGGITTVATPPGTGWGGFTHVLPAGSGVIYAVSADGLLHWYRHTGTTTGAGTWAAGSGAVIGHGWTVFRTIVSAGGGVLYGVLPDGSLLWYHHTGGADGVASWATGSGAMIGHGWTVFTRIVPGAFGALYAITADGLLRWYAHDGWQTGRAVWAAGSGVVIGHGWGAFRQVFSGSGGILFGVLPDGSLHWYDHLGAATGVATWAPSAGSAATGLNLSADTHLAADPTVCSGLDRNDVTSVRRVSSGVLAGAGWSASQFSCLSSIATYESSWRWNAGAISAAYGIPQAMPGTKMASVGADWESNPLTQVRWMLEYVIAHYGSPCAAWTFWQAHHWY